MSDLTFVDELPEDHRPEVLMLPPNGAPDHIFEVRSLEGAGEKIIVTGWIRRSKGSMEQRRLTIPPTPPRPG